MKLHLIWSVYVLFSPLLLYLCIRNTHNFECITVIVKQPGILINPTTLAPQLLCLCHVMSAALKQQPGLFTYWLSVCLSVCLVARSRVVRSTAFILLCPTLLSGGLDRFRSTTSPPGPSAHPLLVHHFSHSVLTYQSCENLRDSFS